jgi:hypothetical protein
MRHSAVSRYHWFSGRMSAEFNVSLNQMRQVLLIIFVLSIAACAARFPASPCTKAPIQIVKSTVLELRASLNNPFLQARYNNAIITLSEVDVYSILDERKAVSVGVAQAIDALEQKLAELADLPRPILEAQIKPKIRTEKGEAQTREILINHEIDVLFLSALRKGKAILEYEGEPVRSVEIQQYTASENDWNTNGIRFMYRTSPVYDYCSVKPPAVNE